MKKSLVLVSAIFCACLLTAANVAGETASGDEPVSLNFEQKPLGEVLATITKMTGHAFIIDDQWLDMPVSISVKATPLHKALKIIFTDINNAIIYQADGKIKIMVYNEAPQKDKASASQQSASQPGNESSPATEQESESTAEMEQEADSSPTTPQEPESSQEAAPEPETDDSADTAEEGGSQPGQEQELEEAQPENPAEEAAEEQSESTEPGTD
jgi:hypothetical protein